LQTRLDSGGEAIEVTSVEIGKTPIDPYLPIAIQIPVHAENTFVHHPAVDGLVV